MRPNRRPAPESSGLGYAAVGLIVAIAAVFVMWATHIPNSDMLRREVAAARYSQATHLAVVARATHFSTDVGDACAAAAEALAAAAGGNFPWVAELGAIQREFNCVDFAAR